MFSPMLASRSPQAAFQAYSSTAIEGRTAQASPHELVAMLFEGYFDNLNQARRALAEGDRGRKSQALSRAVRIVEEGLRGGLNLTAGGALAKDLNALYGYITSRLTQANLRDDISAISECDRLLRPLREAWASIGQTPPVKVQ
jgi:flagellar secretion chaperone FliS